MSNEKEKARKSSAEALGTTEVEEVVSPVEVVAPIVTEADDPTTGARLARQQAVRYLLWGLISVVVNLGAFYVGYRLLGITYQVANLIAWALGVQCAFWVDRILVFKHHSSRPFHEMGKFYVTRVATYLVESMVLWIGISLLGIPGTWTKVIGQVIAIVGNFFFSKLVVFRKATKTTKAQH